MINVIIIIRIITMVMNKIFGITIQLRLIVRVFIRGVVNMGAFWSSEKL